MNFCLAERAYRGEGETQCVVCEGRVDCLVLSVIPGRAFYLDSDCAVHAALCRVACASHVARLTTTIYDCGRKCAYGKRNPFAFLLKLVKIHGPPSGTGRRAGRAPRRGRGRRKAVVNQFSHLIRSHVMNGMPRLAPRGPSKARASVVPISISSHVNITPRSHRHSGTDTSSASHP